MIEEIERWLDAKRVTLWANWDLTQADERTEAARWFLLQLQSYEGFHLRRLAPARQGWPPPTKEMHESRYVVEHNISSFAPDLHSQTVAEGQIEYRTARKWAHS